MADARRLFSWLLSLRTALAVSTDDEAKMMALPVTTIICKGLDGTGRQGQYKVRRVAASLLQGFVCVVDFSNRNEREPCCEDTEVRGSQPGLNMGDELTPFRS